MHLNNISRLHLPVPAVTTEMIPVKSKPKLKCAIRTPSRENRSSGHKLACTVTGESCGFEISDLIVKRKRKLVDLRFCLFDFLFYVIQCNGYGHVRTLSVEWDVKQKKQTNKKSNSQFNTSLHRMIFAYT